MLVSQDSKEMTVIRTQIQLRDDQARALREMAGREDVSLAELIRRGVDRLLAEAQAGSGRTRLDALRIAGRFDSGTPDVAERHDDELAEAFLDW
ncbi:MAG: ribbon-helix-helix domain-containing protein [Thermoleophilia bacterium]|nr:ribbon-helix-helix domain-containing protein [Thermoleophilia bacterium]